MATVRVNFPVSAVCREREISLYKRIFGRITAAGFGDSKDPGDVTLLCICAAPMMDAIHRVLSIHPIKIVT